MVTRTYTSLALLAALTLPATNAFLPVSIRSAAFAPAVETVPIFGRLHLSADADAAADDVDADDGDNEEAQENPAADPDYPDLEFIDYSDPEYQVDQGNNEELFAADSTDAEIEAMREDRRRRNDEFQFQTYFSDCLQSGDEYKGEWTVYKTSTFLPDLEVPQDGLPRLVKAGQVLNVISSAYKTTVKSKSKYPTDAERIRHEENAVSDKDSDSYKEWAAALDTQDDDDDDDESSQSPEAVRTEKEIMGNTYWPEQLAANDFRGPQGIMVVGAAHTIATGVTMSGEDIAAGDHAGPFIEYRTEVGLHANQLRMRVKFDYSVLESEADLSTPALHLKSMTVCRETRGMWPRSGKEGAIADALFGEAGAVGGLYDPPPVGSDEQAGQYMLLDLVGKATVLFPFKIDQDPDAHEGYGWVTSLDWTPSDMRYQVDRKVKGGAEILGLRTLEVTEVQGSEADRYRPSDGGEDMRQ